jgi:hypothetical protein
MLVGIGGMSSDTGGSGGGPSKQVVRTLPEGFTATDIGGYKLGARLTGNGGTGGASSGGSAGSGGAGGSGGADAGDCGNILLGVVRDFKGANENAGHADFETDGIQGGDVTPGMVTNTLGPDQKPVYSSMCEIGHAMPAPTCPYGAQNTSKALFDQWYNDTPGVNEAYEVSLFFAPQPGNLFTFQSLHYFPIDGAGFMSTAQADDGKPHNFGFTTELHTRFLYKGGEPSPSRVTTTCGSTSTTGLPSILAACTRCKPAPCSSTRSPRSLASSPVPSTRSTCFTPSAIRPRRPSVSTRTSRSSTAAVSPAS